MERVQRRWEEEEGGEALVGKSTRMGSVKGPMGAFLHHASQIGWEVLEPWRVKVREGFEHGP